MLAGRFETGCPALADSYGLDPRPGTLFTLAECENRAGRIGSAAKHYRAYLSLFATLTPELQVRQKGREVLSAEALDANEARIPKLTLVLPPDAPPGTVVKRDGEVVDPSTLGQPQPVDPGEHLVTTEAPDNPTQEMRLTVGMFESKRVVVEWAPAAAPATPPDTVPASSDSGEAGSTLRTAGLIVGGVGAAVLVVGVITGALAASEFGTAEDNCDGTHCNQDGLDAIDRTRPLGNTSTACFVVGGAALAGGVLMFLLAPSGQSEAATAAGRLELQPWVGGTSEGGAVAGIRGAW